MPSRLNPVALVLLAGLLGAPVAAWSQVELVVPNFGGRMARHGYDNPGDR